MGGLTLWGGLLLLGAALLLTHGITAGERRRVAQCRAYLTLLQRIRGQIACYQRPLGEICRALEPELYAACGFGVCADSLAVMLDGADLCLPSDAEGLLRRFGAELGQSYKAEQLTACDAAIAELAAICGREEERLPHRIRLIRTAVVCGALALVLIFL